MKSLLLFLAPATTFAATINLPRAAAPALPPASSLPNGWQYAQCRIDALTPRSLSLAGNYDTAMTGEACIAYCGSKGYNVAGTEYSRECYCGVALPALAPSESDCNMPCGGNSAQACGGPSRLTVYQNVAQGAPVVNPGVNGWTSSGCVADSVQDRTLPQWAKTDGPLTVASCLSACKAGGFSIAGVEYAQECWCGNEASLKPTNDPSQCYMPCVGNHGEICGGPNALNVYTAPSIPPPDSSCLPLRSDGYGLLQNGGFEAGFTGWTPNIVDGQFAPSVDTEHQFEGCNAALVTPTSSPSLSNRQIQISQTINNLTPGAKYLFTGYQGRLPDSLNYDSPAIGVSFGDVRLGVITACGGSGCELSGRNGAQYTKHTIPFTYGGTASSATLTFTITWTSSDPAKGNPGLLFDAFNLVKTI